LKEAHPPPIYKIMVGKGGGEEWEGGKGEKGWRNACDGEKIAKSLRFTIPSREKKGQEEKKKKGIKARKRR